MGTNTNNMGTNNMGTNNMGSNNMLINIDIDTDTQCIICLDKTPIQDKDHITLMNEMHFLIKKCDCLCYAHHKCLEKWMSTNAVCPICKREIAFPMKNTDVIIEIHSNSGQNANSIQNNISGQNNNSIQNNNSGQNANSIQNNNSGHINDIYDNDMRSSHFCIRMIILVFFVLTVLQIVLCN